MKDEINYEDLYGLRVLVFMETEPQSNKYHQVLLSPEMFKSMSATLYQKTGKVEGDIEEVILKTGDEEYNLPDLPEAVSNYNEL